MFVCCKSSTVRLRHLEVANFSYEIMFLYCRKGLALTPLVELLWRQVMLIMISARENWIYKSGIRSGHSTLAIWKRIFFSFKMQKHWVFYLYFWLRYSHFSKMLSNKHFKPFIRDVDCLHWRISLPFGCFVVSYIDLFGVGWLRSNILPARNAGTVETDWVALVTTSS